MFLDFGEINKKVRLDLLERKLKQKAQFYIALSKNRFEREYG